MAAVPRAKPHGRASDLALAIYGDVLENLAPAKVIADACSLGGSILTVSGHQFDLDRFQHVYLCGAGKASCGLAKAMLDILGQRVSGGLIATKYGHAMDLGPVRVMEAGHPIPDENSVLAGEAMLSFASACRSDDLTLFLLSGGASAVMEAPASEVDLLTIGEVTRRMLAAGAGIHDLNIVRARLSRIKAGGLSDAFHGSQVICLVLSDVVDNSYATIGSGPLWPPLAMRDAFEIAKRFDIQSLLPESALSKLKAPLSRRLLWIHHYTLADHWRVIAGLDLAVAKRGLRGTPHDWIDGEARSEATEMVQVFLNRFEQTEERICLFASGEPVVTVTGTGKGGRCQEFACAAAALIEGRQDLAVLAGSTDGTDGPTDAAGGLVDGGSVARAAARGWKVADALHDNNSHAFLEACDGLIHTGPTQSNLNDVFLVVRA